TTIASSSAERPDAAFERIASLFDVGLLKSVKVLVAGCGSGGSQASLQLAMAGVRRFSLWDSDVLGPENVIRHACGRRYIGQRKVEALADLLRDRNPFITVETHDTDLLQAEDLAERIQASTVILLATDNEPTRFHINSICVSKRVPFVVGRVFTRGIGG